MGAANESQDPGTRMIALGSVSLARGFSLIGFETIPDATVEQLQALLEALLSRRERAFVVIEQELAQRAEPWLKRARSEGGRVVVVEVPQLHAPQTYRPAVEDLVTEMLGPSALETRP